MFNKSFNLTQFIKDIPSLSIRRSAWAALTSTLNYRLCSSADRIAQRLLDAGHSPDELKECSPREFKALIAGPETGPSNNDMRTQRQLYLLRGEYAELLAHATLVTTGEKDSDFGSLQATLSFMTGPQRERVIAPDNVKAARAAGFEVTDSMVAAAQRAMLSSDNHFAQQRAKRVGLTEWIIDQLFANVSDEEDDEMYSQLDVDHKEWLANKFMAWCSSQHQKILMNVLTGRRGDNVLGIADKVIFDSIIAILPDAMYRTATKKVVAKAKAPADKAVKIKAKKVATKSTARRAPAPNQATTITETLPNGIKLTHAA